MSDVKRTSLFLDRDRVRAAQRVLGTQTTTDTIHAALDEISGRAARAKLRDLPLDLTMDDLRRMRGDPPDNPS